MDLLRKVGKNAEISSKEFSKLISDKKLIESKEVRIIDAKVKVNGAKRSKKVQVAIIVDDNVGAVAYVKNGRKVELLRPARSSESEITTASGYLKFDDKTKDQIETLEQIETLMPNTKKFIELSKDFQKAERARKRFEKENENITPLDDTPESEPTTNNTSQKGQSKFKVVKTPSSIKTQPIKSVKPTSKNNLIDQEEENKNKKGEKKMAKEKTYREEFYEVVDEYLDKNIKDPRKDKKKPINENEEAFKKLCGLMLSKCVAQYIVNTSKGEKLSEGGEALFTVENITKEENGREVTKKEAKFKNDNLRDEVFTYIQERIIEKCPVEAKKVAKTTEDYGKELDLVLAGNYENKADKWVAKIPQSKLTSTLYKGVGAKTKDNVLFTSEDVKTVIDKLAANTEVYYKLGAAKEFSLMIVDSYLERQKAKISDKDKQALTTQVRKTVLKRILTAQAVKTLAEDANTILSLRSPINTLKTEIYGYVDNKGVNHTGIIEELSNIGTYEKRSNKALELGRQFVADHINDLKPAQRDPEAWTNFFMIEAQSLNPVQPVAVKNSENVVLTEQDANKIIGYKDFLKEGDKFVGVGLDKLEKETIIEISSDLIKKAAEEEARKARESKPATQVLRVKCYDKDGKEIGDRYIFAHVDSDNKMSMAVFMNEGAVHQEGERKGNPIDLTDKKDFYFNDQRCSVVDTLTFCGKDKDHVEYKLYSGKDPAGKDVYFKVGSENVGEICLVQNGEIIPQNQQMTVSDYVDGLKKGAGQNGFLPEVGSRKKPTISFPEKQQEGKQKQQEQKPEVKPIIKKQKTNKPLKMGGFWNGFKKWGVLLVLVLDMFVFHGLSYKDEQIKVNTDSGKKDAAIASVLNNDIFDKNGVTQNFKNNIQELFDEKIDLGQVGGHAWMLGAQIKVASKRALGERLGKLAAQQAYDNDLITESEHEKGLVIYPGGSKDKFKAMIKGDAKDINAFIEGYEESFKETELVDTKLTEEAKKKIDEYVEAHFSDIRKIFNLDESDAKQNYVSGVNEGVKQQLEALIKFNPTGKDRKISDEELSYKFGALGKQMAIGLSAVNVDVKNENVHYLIKSEELAKMLNGIIEVEDGKSDTSTKATMSNFIYSENYRNTAENLELIEKEQKQPTEEENKGINSQDFQNSLFKALGVEDYNPSLILVNQESGVVFVRTAETINGEISEKILKVDCSELEGETLDEKIANVQKGEIKPIEFTSVTESMLSQDGGKTYVGKWNDFGQYLDDQAKKVGGSLVSLFFEQNSKITTVKDRNNENANVYQPKLIALFKVGDKLYIMEQDSVKVTDPVKKAPGQEQYSSEELRLSAICDGTTLPGTSKEIIKDKNGKLNKVTMKDKLAETKKIYGNDLSEENQKVGAQAVGQEQNWRLDANKIPNTTKKEELTK